VKINSIPYAHLLAVLRAEEAGKDIVRRPDGVRIYAMDFAGELHELAWVDPWLSGPSLEAAVDQVKFRGQGRPPITLAELEAMDINIIQPIPYPFLRATTIPET
jgi:hypothetical protein